MRDTEDNVKKHEEVQIVTEYPVFEGHFSGVDSNGKEFIVVVGPNREKTSFIRDSESWDDRAAVLELVIPPKGLSTLRVGLRLLPGDKIGGKEV